MTDEFPTINALWAHAVVDELARAGVRHAVISPGSRSTPLVLALADHPDITDHSIIDERSAAYFALGLAKASGVPAAVVCTSGTAAANYLPAVCEADASHVPLVVLTADRPTWLRASGAPQTMDQVHLYGNHVRCFFDAPDPVANGRTFRALRSMVAHAAAVAAGVSQGPVHLNFPFDKPLEPVGSPSADAAVPRDFLYETGEDVWGRAEGRPFIQMRTSRITPDSATLDAIEDRLRAVDRVLLFAGPESSDDMRRDDLRMAVREFARATGVPVIAEAASNLRFQREVTPGLVGTADLLIRNSRTRALLTGALCLRIGGTATTAVGQRILADPASEQIRITGREERIDTDHVIGTVVVGDPAATLHALAARFSGHPPASLDRNWRDSLLAADAAAARAADGEIAAMPWDFEAPAWSIVARSLRDGDALVVSSSMPVRDLETFVPVLACDVDVFSNRGLNGIDGVASTAFGIARARGGRTIFVTGDIAFLHDAGALLVRNEEIHCAVIVINNDGGEIFDMLPVRNFEPAYSRHFVTAHGRDLVQVAAAYGHPHILADSPETLGAALGTWRNNGGIVIIEVRTDRVTSRDRRTGLFSRIMRLADEEFQEPGLPPATIGNGHPHEEITGFNGREDAASGYTVVAHEPGHIGHPATRVTPVILSMRRLRASVAPARDALLLHGFTRTGAMWTEFSRTLARGVMVTDLPGHGAGPLPDPAVYPELWSLDATAQAVIALIERHDAGPLHLGGYSMGGRVALRAAILRPDLCASLTLISASPGIEDEVRRNERRAIDEQLAARIIDHGLERFIDDWMRIPLLDAAARLDPATLRTARNDRLRGSAAGFAASLRGLGQGVQPSQWDALPALRIPLLLVAGERDAAYVAVLQRMHGLVPTSRFEIIANASHDVPAERCDALRLLCDAFWRGHE